MRHDAMNGLVDAIYDAAVDPTGWPDVMEGVRSLLRTDAETLYFLDEASHAKEVLQAEGIDPDLLPAFEAMFYRPDNPWTAVPELDQPGLVRTDETLCERFDSGDILTRSCYYNEWMRPQRLRHSVGMTLFADDGCNLHFTLLRAGKAGPFTADETKRFGHLGGHLRRAARLARRLDRLTAGRGLAAQALDALRHGIVLLDETGRLLHANRAAEALFADGDSGLRLRGNRIAAADPAEDARLAGLVRMLCKRARGEVQPHPAPVGVRAKGGARLWVSGARLSGRHRGFLGPRPVVLLTIVDPAPPATGTAALMERRYQLNRTETRLAQALLAGQSVREAAEEARITYETARTYLKAIFQKTETSRQGELVARLLGDVMASAIDGTG